MLRAAADSDSSTARERSAREERERETMRLREALAAALDGPCDLLLSEGTDADADADATMGEKTEMMMEIEIEPLPFREGGSPMAMANSAAERGEGREGPPGSFALPLIPTTKACTEISEASAKKAEDKKGGEEGSAEKEPRAYCNPHPRRYSRKQNEDEMETFLEELFHDETRGLDLGDILGGEEATTTSSMDDEMLGYLLEKVVQ